MPFANREDRNRWRREGRARRRAQAHRERSGLAAPPSPGTFGRGAPAPVPARQAPPELPTQGQPFQPFAVDCGVCFDTGRTHPSGSPGWCPAGQKLFPTTKKRTGGPKPVATDSLPEWGDLLKAATCAALPLAAIVLIVWVGKKILDAAGEAAREIVIGPTYQSWGPEIAAQIRSALPGAGA